MKTYRLAAIEKILMETDQRIKMVEESEHIIYVWGGDTIKMLEIIALKSNAYDQILKLLMEDE